MGIPTRHPSWGRPLRRPCSLLIARKKWRLTPPVCTPHHPTSQVTLGLNINLVCQPPHLPLANLVASFPYGGLMLPRDCAICRECTTLIPFFSFYKKILRYLPATWQMSTFIAKDKISFSIFFTLIHVGGVCKGVVHAPYLYMYTPRLLASYFYYYPT